MSIRGPWFGVEWQGRARGGLPARRLGTSPFLSPKGTLRLRQGGVCVWWGEAEGVVLPLVA